MEVLSMQNRFYDLTHKYVLYLQLHKFQCVCVCVCIFVYMCVQVIRNCCCVVTEE